MAQPRPGVLLGRPHAAEIEHCALHAAGRRENVLDAGIAPSGIERNGHRQDAWRRDGYGMQRVALPDSIRAPERKQSTTGGRNVLRQFTPLARFDEQAV